jgi:hypothetical protein
VGEREGELDADFGVFCRHDATFLHRDHPLLLGLFDPAYCPLSFLSSSARLSCSIGTR